MTVYKIFVFSITIVILLYPINAFAYVGPGAGLSLLGTLIGTIVAIIMALFVVLFWPIRILIKKIKNKINQHNK